MLRNLKNDREDDFLLALRLQQEELELARSKTIGKYRAGSDPTIALDLLTHYSKQAYEEYQNEKLVKSISRAVDSDFDLIQQLENCRLQEESDHEYARRLSGLTTVSLIYSVHFKAFLDVGQHVPNLHREHQLHLLALLQYRLLRLISLPKYRLALGYYRLVV